MNVKPKIAVILSGCGVQDGAEIHESVLSLLAIDQLGADAACYAPDTEQTHVINHLTGEEMPEKRNVLVEAARIARGKIADLATLNPDDVDALLFPGGFGAAKNLSSFAFDGAGCTVHPAVEAAVKSMVEAGKPIGALCISPAVMAKILPGALVTIGNDTGTIETIKAMGGKHEITSHGQITFDPKYKLVCAPCYMLPANLWQIFQDAEAVVRRLLTLTKKG